MEAEGARASQGAVRRRQARLLATFLVVLKSPLITIRGFLGQETVFGLFQKLDARVEGTGLGLALVRRIVEVHGPRVWIESQGNGRGTAVCFTLPAPKA